jgi:hypothetical protein
MAEGEAAGECKRWIEHVFPFDTARANAIRELTKEAMCKSS